MKLLLVYFLGILLIYLMSSLQLKEQILVPLLDGTKIAHIFLLITNHIWQFGSHLMIQLVLIVQYVLFLEILKGWL